MSDPASVRALALFVPAGLTFGLWSWRRPEVRARAAVLLASAWTFAALVLLQVLATRCAWWRYDAAGGLLLGMPVDLLLGWTLLWGTVPALAAPRLPLVAWAAAACWLDLFAMPACHPVVVLQPHWLAGEAVGLLLCAPGQLIARWTVTERRLPARVALQAICFASLLLGVLPAAILSQTGASWSALSTRPGWLTSAILQSVVLFGVPGIAAVQEFARRGDGTPLPYDPPRRLVTSGPYAYVANPMQLSMSAVLVSWGISLGSLWVASAGAMGVAYSAGLATWDEGEALHARFGRDWGAYRKAVRSWIPRLRPFVPKPARLYVAQGCDPCSALGAWLAARDPVGLALVAAEEHPIRALQRLTYDPGDGTPEEDGVAALARALEHLHLGWAFLGWTLRLPLLCSLAQLLADASGGGPRAIGSRP